MKLSDFDFELPEELIALRPAVPRSTSRLFVSDRGQHTLTRFDALADHLREGDLLVFNDTKVLPARLRGTRTRGEAVANTEITLLEEREPGTWLALGKPAKRLKEDDVIDFGPMQAQVLSREGGEIQLRFTLKGPEFLAALAQTGDMPLPPYIAAKRAPDAQDHTDYQTVFAEHPGSVAAPTASLHFDDAVLEALTAKGINQTRVTLHVGAGTFLPVKTDDISEHKMHAETGSISESSAQNIARALAENRRIIPVGTTALRLVETAAPELAAGAPWSGATDIFIRPGHQFAIASGLITNFHLPRSTLLMLVSALIGKPEMDRIYQAAIAEKFRFFSYGDSSLLIP